MPPRIRCTNLVKNFAATRAIDRISLEVERGTFFALLGPSGCGKTTLLRLIAGFERADSGRVELDGRVVCGPGVHVPPERRRVGMVFQDHALFPHMSVRDNVGYGLRKHPDRRRRTTRVLELVGLEGLADRLPDQLSGGQQQRVALARAIAPEPDVILLDEPFSSLDAGHRASLRGEVRRILRAAETTAVFVTHDQEEAMSLADSIAVVISGRIHQNDSAEIVARKPASLEVARFLGQSNVLPGVINRGLIECELGPLPLPEHTGNSGPEVQVVVRREALRAHVEASDGSDAMVSARVREREFLGTHQRLLVELGSGLTLEGTSDIESPISPGEIVRLEVTGEVVVFPLDSTVRP